MLLGLLTPSFQSLLFTNRYKTLPLSLKVGVKDSVLLFKGLLKKWKQIYSQEISSKLHITYVCYHMTFHSE